MTDSEKIDKLNLLADNLFGAIQQNALGMYSPPFDISRPNIHESKKEFLKELKTVLAAKDHLNGLFDLLVGPPDKEEVDPSQLAMIERLKLAIETHTLQRNKATLTPNAWQLALKNVRDTGFYYNSLHVIFELIASLDQRLKDLREQEVQFWTMSNRAPNYYARTIALRFARVFAGRTGKRPTFGISSEGSHPSTDFGRALEEVFRILEIKVSVRHAAEWALAQLTENDLNPSRNALGNGLLAMLDGSYRSVTQPNPKEEIVRLLNEKGK